MRYLVYGGAAGGGKSWLGCEWLLAMCLMYPGSRWFMGREELKRLRKSTLVTWGKVNKFHAIPPGTWELYANEQIRFSNGSEIDLLDLRYKPGDDPLYERFGSLEYTGGWIEEGGEVNEGAFDMLRARVNRHMNRELGLKAKLLVTCNPKKNWLYHQFYQPWKESTLSDDSAFIQAFAQDNPYTAEDYIESLASIKNTARRERLLHGNWEYEDDPDALVEYEAIIDTFRNDHVPARGHKYLTADIATRGSDKFVLAVWHGWVLVHLETHETTTGKDVVEHMRRLIREHRIRKSNVIFDADGVGSGITGWVKGAREFYNAGKPLNAEPYEHLKAQCYYHLAEKINAGEVYLKSLAGHELHEQAVAELEQIKSRDTDHEGKLRLIRKTEVKNHIGRSPDLADALMMRVWFDLKTGNLKMV